MPAEQRFRFLQEDIASFRRKLMYAQAAATTDEEREILSLTLDLVDDASLHLFIRHTPSHEFPI
jgi:hypothetical protein